MLLKPLQFLTTGLISSTVIASSVSQETLSTFRVNDDLMKLHRDLIQLKSVSGYEIDVADYLQHYLELRDFTVELETVNDDKNRKNVYAYYGKNRNTTVLLTSHIDTVPPFFNYSVVDNRIYGRGSVDAKSCVAAQIVALTELFADGEVDKDDVGLLFVVDEEVQGRGMVYASENLGVHSWKHVIFGEPTENRLGVGHKGMASAQLKAHGKAAHSGYPHLGISATEILIDALSNLLKTELPTSDLLGPSSLNIGRLSGGVANNVVPAEAEASVLIRIAADEDKVVSILKDAAASSEHLELTDLYHRPPQYLDFEVPGFESIILAYGTDVANLQGNFTSRYLYGPGSILVAHSANEYITIEDLHESVEGYKKLVRYSLTGNTEKV